MYYKDMKRWHWVIFLFLLTGAVYYTGSQPYPPQQDPPAPQATSSPVGLETVAKDLTVPWSIAFLPTGDTLLTERPGRLLKIGRDRVVVQIAGVEQTSEGGLLGLALHPDFERNRWIYLYLTTRTKAGLRNQIERHTFDGARLTEKRVILADIPGSSNHDGGRIAFGPDGHLYATTGDAGNERAAQDKNSLAGKILRMKDDGGVPADNPFSTLVWSYGHRNPQGLAWDETGRLWQTEHGRSGLSSGYDELNLIEKGGNYGWPDIEGDERRPGMKGPVLHSGRSDTWAPAGLAYANGRLFWTGLRGEALYEVATEKPRELKTHFKNELGRLRAVHMGPDDYLYISTSNRDGRGTPAAEDDRILRIKVTEL
jgi:glucose/arabinose dehydrogenase